MKKSEIFMGMLTAVFLISCGLYIKLDMDKHQIKPCEISYASVKEKVKEYKEPVFSNNKEIEIKDIEQEIYTDEEIELLARAVMSEASILPYHGKIAIVAVIANRVKSDKFPNTIEEVLYQANQFSLAYNGDPTEECYNAIYDYVESGWPEDMFYFSSGAPHSFGYEYCHIGNTFFNTENNKAP